MSSYVTMPSWRIRFRYFRRLSTRFRVSLCGLRTSLIRSIATFSSPSRPSSFQSLISKRLTAKLVDTGSGGGYIRTSRICSPSAEYLINSLASHISLCTEGRTYMRSSVSDLRCAFRRAVLILDQPSFLIRGSSSSESTPAFPSKPSSSLLVTMKNRNSAASEGGFAGFDAWRFVSLYSCSVTVEVTSCKSPGV